MPEPHSGRRGRGFESRHPDQLQGPSFRASSGCCGSLRDTSRQWLQTELQTKHTSTTSAPPRPVAAQDQKCHDVIVVEPKKRAVAALDAAMGNSVQSALSTYLMVHGSSVNEATLVAAWGGAVVEQLSGASRVAMGRMVLRLKRFLTRSGEIAGCLPDELISDAVADEQKFDLLVQAIDAACRAATEDKIDTLAVAFALGMIEQDEATVDERILVFDALAQIEAFHLRLLAVLQRQARDPSTVEDANEREVAESWRYAWTRAEVLEREPGLATVVDALVAKAQSLGLIHDAAAGGYGGPKPHWELTSFGRICVAAWNQRGRAASPPGAPVSPAPS